MNIYKKTKRNLIHMQKNNDIDSSLEFIFNNKSTQSDNLGLAKPTEPEIKRDICLFHNISDCPVCFFHDREQQKKNDEILKKEKINNDFIEKKINCMGCNKLCKKVNLTVSISDSKKENDIILKKHINSLNNVEEIIKYINSIPLNAIWRCNECRNNDMMYCKEHKKKYAVVGNDLSTLSKHLYCEECGVKNGNRQCCYCEKHRAVNNIFCDFCKLIDKCYICRNRLFGEEITTTKKCHQCTKHHDKLVKCTVCHKPTRFTLLYYKLELPHNFYKQRFSLDSLNFWVYVCKECYPHYQSKYLKKCMKCDEYCEDYDIFRYYSDSKTRWIYLCQLCKYRKEQDANKCDVM